MNVSVVRVWQRVGERRYGGLQEIVTVVVHTVETYRGSRDIAPLYLNLALDGDERSVIRPGRLNSQERTSCDGNLNAV